MNEDIEVLSGRFGNRRGTSDDELSAAGYLFDRFKNYSPFTYIDSFLTIESTFILYAMYYAEFLIVSIVAWACSLGSALFGIKLTGLATFYGIFVFVAYLIESSGIRLMSRLIPPAESQNVVAPFHVEKPKRLILVTAGYDTQVDGILSKLLRSGYAHWAHRIILLLMLIVIGTVASSELATLQDSTNLWASVLRWSAVACLLGAAMFLYVHDRYGDDVRGANNNASGVSILISIAEILHKTPQQNSDVWLVALGNSYGSHAGIQHILAAAPQSVSETYIINLQGVGCGELHYLSKEGFMGSQAYKTKLIELARQHATKFDIRSGEYHGLPTPAHWPNQQGYAALSLIGLHEQTDTAHAWSSDDRHTEIDDESIQSATDFTCTLLHSLDSED